jgi:hypothetical protein
MRVIISDHYDDARHHIEGNVDDIRSQILDFYPYLLQKLGAAPSVEMLINELNKHQGVLAKILDDTFKSLKDGNGLHHITYDIGLPHGQLSINETLMLYRDAAEFLAGHPCTEEEMKQAFKASDGDPLQTVILAFNLTKEDKKELEAIVNLSLKKTEDVVNDPVKFQTIEATNAASEEFAEYVTRANEAGLITHIYLGKGKHNKGTLKVRDPKTQQTFILKPGSGKQNPALGENESRSSQSQREAAFYLITEAWGISDHFPECRLLLLDGKDYACMKMLPLSYKNMNDLRQHDFNLPVRLLYLYNDSRLHQWATIDYVLGNPDRNAGNIMASGHMVYLIDQGSALSGEMFDPAVDKYSFVPFYLRAGCNNFDSLSIQDKLRKMPRLNSQTEEKFKRWLLSLNKDILEQLLGEFSIDATSEKKRLEKLQNATSFQTADLAVLSAWIIP